MKVIGSSVFHGVYPMRGKDPSRITRHIPGFKHPYIDQTGEMRKIKLFGKNRHGKQQIKFF
jgi:hypothetical protein